MYSAIPSGFIFSIILLTAASDPVPAGAPIYSTKVVQQGLFMYKNILGRLLCRNLTCTSEDNCKKIPNSTVTDDIDVNITKSLGDLYQNLNKYIDEFELTNLNDNFPKVLTQLTKNEIEKYFKEMNISSVYEWLNEKAIIESLKDTSILFKSSLEEYDKTYLVMQDPTWSKYLSNNTCLKNFI